MGQVSLSKTTFNVGEIITINTNRQSPNYTNRIRIHMERIENGTIVSTLNQILATNIGDSYNWDTGFQELYNQIYNTDRNTGTISCECYDGERLVDVSYVEFTAIVTPSKILLRGQQHNYKLI